MCKGGGREREMNIYSSVGDSVLENQGVWYIRQEPCEEGGQFCSLSPEARKQQSCCNQKLVQTSGRLWALPVLCKATPRKQKPSLPYHKVRSVRRREESVDLSKCRLK